MSDTKLNPGERIILEKNTDVVIFTKLFGSWFRNRHQFLVKIYLTDKRLYVEQMGLCMYDVELQRIQNVMVGAPTGSSSFLDFLFALKYPFIDTKRGVSVQFQIEKNSPNPLARGRLVTLFLDLRDDTDLWFRKIIEARGART